MKKNLVFILLGIFCFIFLVSAIEINNFSGYGTSENLTFAGNENQTLNLTIPKNAIVTSAFMNLSGYDIKGDFRWESNDTKCFGLSTSLYSYKESFVLQDLINVVSTSSGGGISGYTWNGSGWDSNATIVSGISISHPSGSIDKVYSTIFNVAGVINIIIATSSGNVGGTCYDTLVEGYTWNGAGWTSNSTVVSGITKTNIRYLKPEGVLLGDHQSLIIHASYRSDCSSNGNAHLGYTWNGAGWTSNSTVVSGILNDASYYYDGVFDSFNIGDNIYLLNRHNQALKGYSWSGSSWVSNSSIISGLSYDSLTDGHFTFNSSSPDIIDLCYSHYEGSWLNDGFSYNSDYSITNPSIFINGTRIWNIDGEFFVRNNKTSDLSSILMTALNLENCDCTGCSLIGNTCNISTIFHSDTAGKLQYSDINITYTPAPFVTLVSPSNNTASSSTKTFNCSTTDEEGLVNITHYFWNSTGGLNLSVTTDISNTYNSTTYDMIFNSSGAWTWGCSAYNNNSRSWWADDNFTINVDIDDPTINLNVPTNLQYINTANVQFNYTPEHSTQTVEVCELYSNFTGTWLINQTNITITEDVVNSFNQTLSEGYYLWNVKCNTTETSNLAFAISNFTFTLDTTDPIMNNMTITTTADQTQFNFTSNITDTNLDSCKYSVWTGSTPGTNNSFTCNDNITATAPGFGTYNLVVWATDLASNENSQNLSFTTSVSGGGVVTGGGGSSSTIIVSTDKGWIMESSKGQAKFEADMSKGTERKFNIQFENLGDSSKTITLSCQDIKGLACQYVEFPEETFELALLKDTKQTVSFLINLPDTAKKGDYQFNIRALDDQERDGTVTVFLGIGTLGIFQAFISKVLFTRTNFGFPYALIFFPSLIILFIASSKLIKKGTPLKPIWVILISLITSIFLVWLI